jgi:deoxyribose-phosphate aldolase
MYLFNSIIDYTLLEETNENELQLICAKAKKYEVASVCVYPKWVSFVQRELENSNLKVCTVISFPEGTTSKEDKIEEICKAVSEGADEVDIVLNYQNINNSSEVFEELKEIQRTCVQLSFENKRKITSKIIVESGLLTRKQVEQVTELCILSQVDFIKTSTGKVSVGAELDKVQVMYATIQKKHSTLKIKASGGIRSNEHVLCFLPFVDRLGIGYKTVDTLNQL